MAFAAAPARAQSLGPSTGGIGALDQALRFLGHNKRVLMIAAHPDDEDTELLTVLARGMGVESAYLALTRGEGGQNLIGNELGPALGVLRSEELLAARALDGARQYFTRAYDFGFSKSLADTWRFWPQDSVLKDVVRVIRRFRPQIVVAIFSGTPRDGHGQHQASGWAAREAFQAAGDAARFPELAREEGLAPWQPLKLYQSARFDAGPALTLDGGLIDRSVGQSYLQIAMRGRSLHRSQDMGSAQRMGPSTVRLRVVEDRTGQAAAGLFAGIDTTLASLLPADLRASRGRAAAGIEARLRGLGPLDADSLPGLRRALLDLLGPASGWLAETRDQVHRMDAATTLASGVLCDAVAATERVAPGGTLSVTLSCWNTAAGPVTVTTRVIVAGGRPLESRGPVEILPGRIVTDTQTVTVGRDVEPTRPYYLARPLLGAWYDWPLPDRDIWGDPFEAPPFRAEFRFADGRTVRREVVYRVVDQAIGEVRRPVFVVPPIEVRLEPASGLWPVGDGRRHDFQVQVRSNAGDTATASVALALPPGWVALPRQEVRLPGAGRDTTVRFQIPGPAVPGRFAIRARVSAGAGAAQDTRVERVEYPHIRPRHLLHPAMSPVSLVDVRVPGGLRVGYVRGAADRIPEAVAALGLVLVPLTRDSLARADLSRFHSIVVGPRAYETEPALLQHNDRLLAYVAAGGTLVVQYQQQPYFRGGFAPYALSLAAPGADPSARVANARVAEEDAPVTVVAAGHAVLRAPNPIGPADWRDWVQERGLYFPRSWGSEWTPILAMADAGEAPLQGALLVAGHGRGTYVYTGLSFFRQLPAAVPGAARLFVNLLSLGN